MGYFAPLEDEVNPALSASLDHGPDVMSLTSALASIEPRPPFM